MKRARGFTVVEVSLVMLLTLLLMSLATAFFVRGQRYVAETETYSSTQRSANTLLRKMSDDIYHSTKKQLEVGNGSLVFLSFGPTDESQPALQLHPTSGLILWKKWVGYSYNAAEETIYRGELPLLDSTMDPIATPPEPMFTSALAFATDPQVARQPLAGKVRDFSVLKVNDRRIQLSVTTWGETPITHTDQAQREVVVSVKTEVALLN